MEALCRKKPSAFSSHPTPKHPNARAKSVRPGGACGQPVFNQPKPSPDPTGFKNPVTDQKFKGIRTLEPVPQPRGGAEPIVTLEEVYGTAGAAKIAAIEKAGQIVFHSVGDTGSVVGPANGASSARACGGKSESERTTAGRRVVAANRERRRPQAR